MHRHLEDRPCVNNDNVYSGSSLLVPSLPPSNTLTHSSEDVRIVNPGSVAPLSTVRPSVSPTSFPLHNQGQSTSAPVQRQPLSLVQKTVHSVGTFGGTEIQSNLQFAIPVVQQPRIPASATLSQTKHNHNISSTGLHHSHSVQAQVHAPKIVHPSQPPAQVLEVEDALSYLDQFKNKFGNKPQVYKEFLDIMKEFKSKSIDTPGVIQRVATLLHGDPQMIAGFNTFLPIGYRMEVRPTEQIQVGVPSGGPRYLDSSTTIPPATLHPSTNLNSQTSHSSHGNQLPHVSHSPSHLSSSTANKPPKLQTATVIGQTHHSSKNHLSYHQNSPVHPQSSNASSSITIKTPVAQVNEPVKFNAINYVSKIKDRFHNQPEIYKKFLDIIHIYEKGQRSLKDGTPGTKQLSGAEFYTQVATLFQNQEDLLQEFGQFMPDVNGSRNVLVNLQTPRVPSNENESSLKAPVTFKSTTVWGGNETKPVVANECSSSPVPFQPVKKPRLTKSTIEKNEKKKKQGVASLKDVAFAEAGKNVPAANFDISSLHSAHSQSGDRTPTNVNISSNVPQAIQNVDYDNAMNYVNKIKICFQGQPETYKHFLEILHTYQNLKDGTSSGTKRLTGADVYAQVSKLLHKHEDLLQEFSQFMPDANGSMNVLDSLNPPKSEINNYDSSSKKLVLASKQASSEFKQAATKHHASSVAHHAGKKAKISSSLKSVSLEEAKKYVTSTELAFFDRIRKCLKPQHVYDNFLRCLVLYHQGTVSSSELLLLVSPFLEKLPDLHQWFNNFLGYKEQKHHIETVPIKIQSQERKRCANEFATDSDSHSYKRCGTSYRAVPGNFVQPKCSGRSNLDEGLKEVLNDTWMSFPSWSEDSTISSSRKTQYEEYIYKCEDERSELDIVLETNLSTIKFLERIQGILNRMPPDKKAKLKIDDSLEETLSVLHEQPIKRVYGEKAAGIIEGLRKNPMVAVPVVLRRLKAKNEEWRTARKGFNKIWKEQNEKYYLKSLDHQGLSFKQNDIKFLRPKNIMSEIEVIYEERRKQTEVGICDVPVGPHIVVFYKDKARIEDAANLIIHHVKRQIGNQKDKKKIKALVRQFIPDFFSTARGELSDDEVDYDSETEDGNDSRHYFSRSERLRSKANNASIPHSACSPESAIKEENKSIKNVKNCDRTQTAVAENSNSGDTYTVMFGNNEWYIFLRIHQLLCERLGKIYEHSQSFLAAEIKDREKRKVSTALAMKLKPKNEIDVEDYYPTFLNMIKNVLDGNMESNQYEDTLREMFSIHAYLGFTLDKVVQTAVRQLQHLVVDEASVQCTNLYLSERKDNAASPQRAVTESVYQKKCENILNDENCFKILLNKNEGKLSIELLDNEADPSEDDHMPEKYDGDEDSYFYEEEY